MKHLMGYLVLAAAAAILSAAPLSAMDRRAPARAAQGGRPAANARPPGGGTRQAPMAGAGNLDPARGPVVSNPNAYPHEMLGNNVPRNTWPGYGR